MINAFLIENKCYSQNSFKETLLKFASDIQLVKHTSAIKEVENELESDDVVFYDLSLKEWESSPAFFNRKKHSRLVGIGRSKADAYHAFKIKATDFILTPCAQNEISGVINRLLPNKVNKKILGELIGIPTIEGFEFFSTKEIIRCEGYQNCTRIITETRPDIISSYNIGVFRKKLAQYDFFSPHKSHLVNIAHIRKYHKEGSIHLSDKSVVPVAKRRKSDFMQMMAISR